MFYSDDGHTSRKGAYSWGLLMHEGIELVRRHWWALLLTLTLLLTLLLALLTPLLLLVRGHSLQALEERLHVCMCLCTDVAVGRARNSGILHVDALLLLTILLHSHGRRVS